MSLRKYASYKDTGIAWLGKVPAHWEVKKLKYVCLRSGLYGANVAATHYRETGVRFLRTTDITDDGHIKKDGVFLPEELVRDYILNDGDILLSRSGTVGRSLLYQSKLHGPCSYAGYLVRFVPNPHTLPRYVFFFTKTHAFERFLRLMAISATIENVNADKYANAHLPAPPLEEQQKIAAFLDKETAQIDALIDEQTRLISLLREKRQAVISNAVTKGLNPNATMKDSEIEWIGKVPAHWTVTFIKRRYEITLGKMLKSNQTEPDETEEPYLRTVNIHWRGIDTSDVKRMWFTDYEKQKLKLCKNDLLVCEGGDVGRSALWNDEIEDCYIQNSINRIRAREDADTRFLFYWLYFIKHIGYIDMICNKATIAHFTVEKVGATPCVYPPLEEQEEIADYLDRETKQIDALIEECEMAIGLLKERRTALISAAVTGAIDVRHQTQGG